MQQYHFTFVHRPGKTNPADPLSRRPDFEKGVNDNKQQILLPDSMFQTRQNTIEMRFPDQIKELQSKVEDYIIQDIKSGKESSWNQRDGIVYWKDLIYVPKDDKLRESIIVKNHDHPIAGHPGAKRTKSLMLTKFYWPNLGKDVKKYVESCDRCQKTKTKRKTTVLHPHNVPENPWETISIDIIGPLPESSGKNAILTIVDIFSKMIHLFPVSTDITALGVAKIYRDHIFKLHGTPKKVISDRGTQFLSSFMTDLYKLLDIEGNPTTAYHPQGNGQAERMNALVEQYLRLYTNHRQSDWMEWLPIAEFVHNQNVSRGTGYSPFVLNYGHNPSIDIKANRKVNNDSTGKFVEEMKVLQKTAQLLLEHAKDDMKKYHDRKAQSLIEYIKGDKVLLKATNIRTERPSRKLDDK